MPSEGVHNREHHGGQRTDDPRIGTVIAGYRIEERIGRGGMGVVYRAEHLNLRRRAAIKIIAPDLAESEGFRERFTREARIAAALQHPNIVTVYDAGEVDGTALPRDAVHRGLGPRGVLRRERRLRPYRAIDVCRQVASALDAAHAMGLIHRDVKPANVLIEGRTAFLTDFGLTKRIEGTHTQLTRAGDVVGTIHYVAPEQIEGRRSAPARDVYSLGCLLYHCLSGQVPFARETDVAVIYAHLSEEPPRLTSLRPELPRGSTRVIAKALDKSPDRRFPTCGDLISAARAVIDAAGPLSETSRRAQHGSPPSDGCAALERDARRGGRGAAPARAARRASTPTRARSRGWRSATASTCSRREAGATADARPRGAPGPRDPRLGRAGRGGRSPRCAATRSRATRRCCCSSTTRRRRAARSPAAGADERLAAPFSPLQLQVKLRSLLGADAVGG